jgi:small subunit ribosomal protein S13
LAQEENTGQHAGKEQHKEEAGIIRLLGKDIKGNYDIEHSLMQIKGIGHNLARALSVAIEEKEGIKASERIGTLEESKLSIIEKIVKNPKEYGVPVFLLNRRADIGTGEDMQLVGTDLIVRSKQDIDADVKIQNWRGFRHKYGQKVRGQKTSNTGRTGSAVGVTKKAAKEAAKPQKAGASGGAAAK